jgi:hypothetical protein
MQFTTYDDTGAYTAAAALDDRPVPDKLFVRYPDVRRSGVRGASSDRTGLWWSAGMTVRATLTGPCERSSHPPWG